MSFGSANDSFAVKKFESAEEVEEKKQKRQEQWEKVRKPDDPEEAPEEETRSLFQQLEDNKDAKDRDHEAEFKMRNSVQGLEEEEAKFLNFVSNRQMQVEREREKEESAVVEEMKEAAVKRVSSKVEPVQETKKPSPAVSASTKKSQQSLLLGAIKRKSADSNSSTSPTEDPLLKLIDTSKPVAQVAGILPGIGSYDDGTSDSQSSDSESDIEDYMRSTKRIRVVYQQ